MKVSPLASPATAGGASFVLDLEALVAEAKTWIGTPWVHGGREKGFGVDCVGLLVESARHVGLDIDEGRNYPALVNPDWLRTRILTWCDSVTGPPATGDVLLIRTPAGLTHVGLDTGDGWMIHAKQEALQGAVTMEELSPAFVRGFVAEVFRLRQVLDVPRDEEWDSRAERAAAEIGDYTWVRRGDVWILETGKGSVYQVKDGGCTCGDWEHFGKKACVPCKHQIALAWWTLQEGA